MRRSTNQHQSDRRGGSLHRSAARLTHTMTLTAALLGLVVLAAGCGGPKTPDNGAGRVLAEFEAYANCMRSHGISDFPDPTTSPGGGVSFQINGGPGSDLGRNNPSFEAANQRCQSLLPDGGSQPPAQSAQKIADEVKWAQCMRSHGLPSFPDPNSQGEFDSSKFNESTPTFKSASNACQSLMNRVGAIPVHPGHG
jgi:hypothetical protein